MDGNVHGSITLNPDRSHRYAHLENSPLSPSLGDFNQTTNCSSTRNSGRRRCSCCSRKCTCLSVHFFTIIALIFSIVACICSGMDLFNVLKSSEEDYNVCIPFKEGENNYIHDLKKTVKDNQFMYCADTPSKIARQLDETITNRSQSFGREVVENASTILGSGKSISAHILIPSTDRTCRYTRQNYSCEAPLSASRSISHYDGVQISGHRIIITITGTYYLYNQMYFKLIPGSNVDNNKHKVKIFHRVYVRRDNLPENNGQREILSSSDLIYLKGKSHYFRSSSISGTFIFEAGDEIFVIVSNMRHLSKTPENNFIGFFLMG